MANRPVIIRAFEKIPSPVEIVGLGDVRMPRSDAQEVEVAVVVASHIDSPDFDPKLDVEVCWIGCGQLDLLVAGSQWCKGIRSGNAPVETVTATFECDPRHEVLGRGVTPCPPRERPYPSAAISAACGFLLRRTNDRGTRAASAVARQTGATPAKGAGPDLILLPEMELLRGLFGVSNKVLLEFFDGIRNPAILAGRGFFDIDNSYQREDGTVVVSAGWALSNDEAIIAAALITDPALRKLYWAPFQQLSKDGSDGVPVGLNMVWPWPDPIKLTIEGRWVTRVGRRPRFLATRLVSINMPIWFTGIEVHHPGVEKGDLEALPPPDGATRLTNASAIVLVSGASASGFRRSIEVATGEVAIPTAEGIRIVHVALGGKGRTDVAVIGEGRKDEGLASSAGVQSGADPNVSPASLRRKRMIDSTLPTRTVFQALEKTWAALEAACRQGGWTLDALPTGGRSGNRAARHGGLNLSIEPLVAKVSSESSHLLIVDAGSPSADERSVGILMPNKSYSDANLRFFAHTDCAWIDGRWSSKNRNSRAFSVKPFRRSAAVWENPHKHAELIRKRIASAFAPKL